MDARSHWGLSRSVSRGACPVGKLCLAHGGDLLVLRHLRRVIAQDQPSAFQFGKFRAGHLTHASVSKEHVATAPCIKGRISDDRLRMNTALAQSISQIDVALAALRIYCDLIGAQLVHHFLERNRETISIIER